MKILLPLLLLISSSGWILSLTRKERIAIDLRFLSLLCVISYGIFFLTALPFLFGLKWTLHNHTLLIGITGLCPFFIGLHRLIKGETRLVFVVGASKILLFLLIVGAGAWLQRHSIYHFYATHDPSAYLNAAHHIAREGTFVHLNPLAELAYRHKESALTTILGWENVDEAWQATKNFGVVPRVDSGGQGSFHGLFGSALAFAAGIELFGEDSLLRMNWIHFAVSSLLLLTLAVAWAGRWSWSVWLAPLLWAICPLVVYVFREPLSEPLMVVFFLGLLVSSQELATEDKRIGALALALALVGALCTRISALMYLPFLPMVLIGAGLTRRHACWLGACLLLILGLGVAAIVSYSPSYASDILVFYTELVAAKSPKLIAGVAAGILFGLVVFLRFLSPKKILGHLTLKHWQIAWVLYAVGLIAAISFRYARLITKLDHNIGGYPFVLFNFDSLLFYGGPAAILLGLGALLVRYSRRPESGNHFLESFLPFCLFFYAAVRFMPLNTQPNFQRYLIIELIPLAFVGFATFFSQEARSRVFVISRTAIITFSITWSIGIVQLINHDDISSGANTFYQGIRANLSALERSGKRPALLAIDPDWKETTFLIPLSNGFGYPLGFIRHPFSHESEVAVLQLENLGYTPVFVAGKAGAPANFRPIFKASGCYRYPRLGLGAPPLELDSSCVDLAFLGGRHTATTTIAHAWKYRELSTPLTFRHWYGTEIAGSFACGPVNSGLTIKLQQDTGPEFVSPRVFLNGIPTENIEITRLGENALRPIWFVEVSIPSSAFRCDTTNYVDVMTREATILSVDWNSQPIPDAKAALSTSTS